MNQQKKQLVRHERRKMRIRKSVQGTSQKPRLTVFRSHKNIYCQLVDDDRGVTLAAASTMAKDVRDQLSGRGGNKSAAGLVGKALAEKAKGLGIAAVAFDRNGYRFHGRLKALADAVREAGLKL